MALVVARQNELHRRFGEATYVTPAIALCLALYVSCPDFFLKV